MTTANKITICRILTVPLFIGFVLYYVDSGNELYRILACVCFAAAAISDGVDGYIARRYHQHSELGKILDPLADKLLLVSGVVLLSLKNEPYLDRVPLWLTLIILGRDLIILIAVAVIQHVCGRVRVRPAIVGKLATVLQMICVAWVLLKWPREGMWYLAVAAAVCTTISGIIYFIDGVRQLSASPSSSAAPELQNPSA